MEKKKITCLCKFKWLTGGYISGFHLSATVVVSSSGTKGQFNVAVTFDRGRITTCNCTCSANASWCSHVVAVCLHRIHQVGGVIFHFTPLPLGRVLIMYTRNKCEVKFRFVKKKKREREKNLLLIL